MHAMVLLVAIGLASGAAGAQAKLEPPDSLPPAPKGAVWKLVWHDEFDGTTIDTTRWEVMGK